MKPRFIHLRCKTQYSIGESSLDISKIIKLSKENHMPAIAMTDANNMFAAREFSYKVSSNAIKPIIGVEFVTIFEDKETQAMFEGVLVLLAKNAEGYQNLLQLHDKAYMRKSSLHLEIPKITCEELYKYSENIVVLTGGKNGLLANLINNKISLAKVFLKKLSNIINQDLYIEINRFFTHEDYNLEPKFLALAEELHIPIVATNNVTHASLEDVLATDILLCIKQSAKQDDPLREQVVNNSYFKSQEEMSSLFADLPEALENTIKIAKKCNYFVEKQELSLPKFADNEKDLIIHDAEKGLEYRLETEVFPNIEGDRKETEKIYKDRLNFEIDIINKIGFAGYFLIVADFINWAKQNKIPVGPGRGSGAGSLVAWCLSITDVDPIRFSLLFERFLNPERISMPDFDIDFCNNRRDEVIEYVRKKYGIDKVAHIITFGTLQTKAALKDVGRALGMSYSEVDALCKKIPYSSPFHPLSLKDLVEDDEEIKKEIANKEHIKELFDIALKLEGAYRNVSTHAAGVIISKTPLNTITPLFYDEGSDFPSVGFTMKYLEDVGLVKFDFLALKTLTIIANAVIQIKKTENIQLDMLKIPFKDENISSLFERGDCLGLFQLESKGMIEVLKQMKPDKIEDIIAIISLYRPGPMENISEYIARKHGKVKVEHLHPKMEDINKETFGIMVYQEQVMQVAQAIAGYSLGEADLLRRAMGKKDPVEMTKQRLIFVKGALETNQIEDKLASEIFDHMAKFAGYGFNKSHATAYAMISWQTAYLKTYYPAEFLASSMTADIGSNNKEISRFLEFLEDAKKFNVHILSPSINKPSFDFSIEKNEKNEKCIRYSLLAVKGVSKSMVNALQIEIQENGFFKTPEDFLSRIDSKVLNKRQLDALILSGALDDLHSNRKEMHCNIELMLSYNAKVQSEKKSSQIGLFSFGVYEHKPENLHLIKTDKWSYVDQISEELNVIGCFLSGHPLLEYKDLLEKYNVVTYKALLEDNILSAHVAGYLMKIKVSKSKTGNIFVTLTFYDLSTIFSLALFGNNYEKYKDKLQQGQIYIIKTSLKITETEIKVFIENIEILNENYNSKIVISNKRLYKPLHYIANLKTIDELKEITDIITNTEFGKDSLEINILCGDEYLIFSLNNITLNQNEINIKHYHIHLKKKED